MTQQKKKMVFFVDDEPAIRKQMARTLSHLGVEVSCFPGGRECLDQLGRRECDLLITDVKMPGMDGVELLGRVRELLPSLPVLIITGYGDVPMAVRALKGGARDFIEKPLRRDALLSTVRQSLEAAPGIHLPIRDMLTKTEREVFRLMLQGRSTSEIADIRHRSRRTIEDHRTRIFHKFDARNLMEVLHKLGVNPADLLGEI